jgi:predicted RND superfamily exporter protein
MAGDPKQMLQMINEDGSAVRATIFVNNPNYRLSLQLRDYIDNILLYFDNRYNISSHVSGDIPVALEVVTSIVINQLRSISWTMLGIGVLLLITFPRGRAALIAMIPVSTTALIVLAGMGYIGMPLGIATSMFASLTIGVGVDFALHFLHNYQRERRAGADYQNALEATVRNTGQAIRWNVLVLVLGFLALTFSVLKPDRDLGILLASAIVTCYEMTLLFLPKLLKYISFSIVAFLLLIPQSSHAKSTQQGTIIDYYHTETTTCNSHFQHNK